jgi:hypothetical protein
MFKGVTMHGQRIIVVLFVSILLFVGCSKSDKVEMKFLEHFWDKDAPPSLSWASASTSFDYSELESREHDVWGKKTSEKHLFVLIYGELPLGGINIKAIYLQGDNRTTAFVEPSYIENNDPMANYRIREVVSLGTDVKCSYEYRIEPGRYYVFLEQNNTEIAGTTLDITK